MLTYIDYQRRDYYRNGNVRREISFQKLEMGVQEVATICFYGVKALAVVGQVVICSLLHRNPYRLR